MKTNEETLRFDPCQFSNRYKQMAVSARTSIAFSDYRSMHTETHKVRQDWIPPFALNDKQLQQVLLHRAWTYAHGGAPFPQIVNVQEINSAATARALKGYVIHKDAPIQVQMMQTHQTAVRKAGGYMQLHAAIAFRSWRLGMDSVAVAETIGSTPFAVRQSLWRMRDVAKCLGFEVGRAGYTSGKKHKRA